MEVWGCLSESGGRGLLNSLTDEVKNWGLRGFKTTLMTVKEREKNTVKIFFFFFFFNASDYWVQRGEHERGTGFPPAPLLPCRFVPRLRGHCQLAAKSLTVLSPAPSTGAPPPLLGVGGAAEGLVDSLHDGVAVDAEDPQQLVGLAAAWHLGDCQALHGEAGLVHHRRAHRLAETTWRSRERGR